MKSLRTEAEEGHSAAVHLQVEEVAAAVRLDRGEELDREAFLGWLWEVAGDTGLLAISEGSVDVAEAAALGLVESSLVLDAAVAPVDRDWVGSRASARVTCGFDSEAGLMEVRDPNGTVFLRPGIETFPTAGSAPCDVAHGGKSKPVSLSLVQAYFPCDPMFANSMTEGGVASCAPAETFRENSGSPADGWTWGPSGAGTVRLFPKKAAACLAKNSSVPAACPGGLNPEGDTSDVVMTLKLSGVVDEVDGAANGTGSFAVVVQTTMHDRMNGPLTFFGVMRSQFTLANGKATVKTSIHCIGAFAKRQSRQDPLRSSTNVKCASASRVSKVRPMATT